MKQNEHKEYCNASMWEYPVVYFELLKRKDRMMPKAITNMENINI